MRQGFDDEAFRAYLRQYEDELLQETIDPRALPTRKAIGISSEADNRRCEVVALLWS